MSSPPTPIAFCITDLDPGGAERCLVQLVTGLDRDAWAPSVFCLAAEGELAEPIRAVGIDVTCFGARSARDAGVMSRLIRELRRFRPEILQTFLFHANLAGRIAGRRAGVPVIVSGVRVAEREKGWHVRADRWTRRWVDHTVCVSRSVAEFSIRKAGLSPDSVSVIPNGVDAARYAEAAPADLSRFGIPAGARTLLSVGRLHLQKGHDLLMEAVRPILQHEENVHVLVAGEGPQRPTLEARIADSGFASRMHLIGHQQDVAGLMRAATLFILPSRWEGMPNVVLEAMAAGTPVIATPVEGVGELIVNGESGVIVNSVSANDLRSAIADCLADAEHCRQMAESAQSVVCKTFTLQKMVRKYDDLYRWLLKKRKD